MHYIYHAGSLVRSFVGSIIVPYVPPTSREAQNEPSEKSKSMKLGEVITQMGSPIDRSKSLGASTVEKLYRIVHLSYMYRYNPADPTHPIPITGHLAKYQEKIFLDYVLSGADGLQQRQKKKNSWEFLGFDEFVKNLSCLATAQQELRKHPPQTSVASIQKWQEELIKAGLSLKYFDKDISTRELIDAVLPFIRKIVKANVHSQNLNLINPPSLIADGSPLGLGLFLYEISCRIVIEHMDTDLLCTHFIDSNCTTILTELAVSAIRTPYMSDAVVNGYRITINQFLKTIDEQPSLRAWIHIFEQMGFEKLFDLQERLSAKQRQFFNQPDPPARRGLIVNEVELYKIGSTWVVSRVSAAMAAAGVKTGMTEEVINVKYPQSSFVKREEPDDNLESFIKKTVIDLWLFPQRYIHSTLEQSIFGKLILLFSEILPLGSVSKLFLADLPTIEEFASRIARNLIILIESRPAIQMLLLQHWDRLDKNFTEPLSNRNAMSAPGHSLPNDEKIGHLLKVLVELSVGSLVPDIEAFKKSRLGRVSHLVLRCLNWKITQLCLQLLIKGPVYYGLKLIKGTAKANEIYSKFEFGQSTLSYLNLLNEIAFSPTPLIQAYKTVDAQRKRLDFVNQDEKILREVQLSWENLVHEVLLDLGSALLYQHCNPGKTHITVVEKNISEKKITLEEIKNRLTLIKSERLAILKETVAVPANRKILRYPILGNVDLASLQTVENLFNEVVNQLSNWQKLANRSEEDELLERLENLLSADPEVIENKWRIQSFESVIQDPSIIQKGRELVELRRKTKNAVDRLQLNEQLNLSAFKRIKKDLQKLEKLRDDLKVTYLKSWISERGFGLVQVLTYLSAKR